MSGQDIRFEFIGFEPEAEFAQFANERLLAVTRTAPFGATCAASIELVAETAQFRTTIKVVRGGDQFPGISVDSDLEKSLQRCLGQVRGKTFRWRKEKLAQKNKPRKLTPEEASDPFLRMKKKFYTG